MELAQFRTQISEDMAEGGTHRAVWAVIVDSPHAPTGITARPVSYAALSAAIAGMLSSQEAGRA
ncbi:hypothetical protein ACWEJ6_49090 [Nonomuraea sp. NPDC004702]